MTPKPDAFPEYYDVVVAGGGPAGSAAAFTAASADLKVCLVDKAVFPREKLCGGGLTDRCRATFEAVFGRPLPAEIVGDLHHMAFFMAGTRLSRMEGRLGLTMRRAFDAHMVDLAREAGATTRLGDAVDVLDEAARTVTLKSGRVLAYGHLIAADGVSSGIARQMFGAAFDPAAIGFGLEVEVPRADLPGCPEDVEIDFGRADWGYGWVFPKADTFTIGVGGVHRRNPDMKAKLAAYLTDKGLDPAAYKVKGQYLPFGQCRPSPGRGRVLLCGDAAGFVDPITGEGIGYAMESGAAASAAIAQAVAAGRPGGAFADYALATLPIRRSMGQARGWRRLIFSGWAKPLFGKAFGRARLLRQGYLDIMAGVRGYEDLAGLMATEARQALGRRLRRALSKA